MLPTCEKKRSFWILIQLIAFFVMNPQVLLHGDVILFSFAVSIYPSTLGQLCTECLFEGLIG